MPRVTIPRDVSTDTQRAFQEVNRELQRMDIPLLQSLESVRAIAEGTSAYYMDEGTLYRYTKIDRRLFKARVGDIVDQELSQNREDITSLQTEQEEIETRLTEAERDIQTLENDVNALEDDVQALQQANQNQEVQNLTNRVQNAENNLQQLQFDFNNLEQRVNNLEAII